MRHIHANVCAYNAVQRPRPRVDLYDVLARQCGMGCVGKKPGEHVNARRTAALPPPHSGFGCDVAYERFLNFVHSHSSDDVMRSACGKRWPCDVVWHIAYRHQQQKQAEHHHHHHTRKLAGEQRAR